MTDSFGASVRIDKPIGEVFDFLANGENDKKFSPRVLEIAKANPGAPGQGSDLPEHRQGRRDEVEA